MNDNWKIVYSPEAHVELFTLYLKKLDSLSNVERTAYEQFLYSLTNPKVMFTGEQESTDEQ